MADNGLNSKSGAHDDSHAGPRNGGHKGAERDDPKGSESRALASRKDFNLDEMTMRQAVALVEAHINTQNPSAEQVELMRAAMKLLPEVSEAIGNMALQARETMLDKMSANAVIKDSMRRGIEKVQRDLGYESAPAIEKLVIEQIGMCWLLMYETQQRYINARASSTSMSIEQAAWLEKRLSMVQHRYMKSIETLAKVRKLAKPSVAHTVMLNVAKQQINCARRELI